MRSNSLAISLLIKAPAEKVWDSIADWSGQSNWMLQTKVWVTSEKHEGVGTTIAAFTGPFYKFYPWGKQLGVLDLMKVTLWEPPFRCDVIHHGSIIKGTGSFVVEKVDSQNSIFHWSEEIQAPAALFYVMRPFIVLGVKISLARFARLLE
jgi:hypothetical protein